MPESSTEQVQGITYLFKMLFSFIVSIPPNYTANTDNRNLWNEK